MVFNIGNISGTGLGTDAMLGLDVKIGATVSVAIAIAIFLVKRAGAAVDRLVVFLGFVMIVLTGWVALTSGPPVGEALRNTVVPEDIDVLVITTLIGGTVGGYITYAGAHRLLDSGLTGTRHAAGDRQELGDRHPGHRGHAGPAVPRGPRCRRRGRGARRGEPHRQRLPAGGRRGRPAGLRRDPLGGQHHLGHRGVLHLGVLPHHQGRRPNAGATC